MAAAYKLITVVLPQGAGQPLLRQLFERGVTTASFSTARAPFVEVHTRGGLARTHAYSVEKDVVEALVPEERADDTFTFIYEAAGIGVASGGFMFQGPVSAASAFTVPADLPRQDRKSTRLNSSH